METDKTLAFIGGGRITKIFLAAFANKKIQFPSIVVYDTNKDVLTDLKKQFTDIEVVHDVMLTTKQDIVFIALHPPVIMETLAVIRGNIPDKSVVVSLAPKINIEKIAGQTAVKRVVRIIPNATSYVNEGYNPVCFSKNFDHVDKRPVMELMQSLGKTFEVEESKLEGYAMISAMLPTYFWFQWKTLIELGDSMGLTDREAMDSVHFTTKAALEIYFDHNLSHDEVVDLIPVKPIGEHESQITEIYKTRLLGLFQKIKP